MKLTTKETLLPGGIRLAAIALFLAFGAGASGQTIRCESWERSPVRSWTPTDMPPTFIQGDLGSWYLGDTVSSYLEECGPNGNRAEVFSEGGHKILRLTTVPNLECAENMWITLGTRLTPLSIPLAADTRIAFTETGSLVDPHWNGAFPTLTPPPGDNVYLWLQDNRTNNLVYIFQRSADYYPHTTMFGPFGYHEILLGTHDFAGGTFVRNLIADFLEVPGFNVSGASIVSITFQITSVGTATLDDLQIGSGIPLPPPVIVSQPQSAHVMRGDTAFFSVTVDGAGPFWFQWQKDEADLLFENADFLVLDDVQLDDAGSYRVLVTNGGGTTTSDAALLTVEIGPEPPHILACPVRVAVEIGQAATLTVEATGTPPLAYQWYHDGTEISGATDPELTLDAVTPDDAGQYHAVVSNEHGSATSLSAPLFVTRVPVASQAALETPNSVRIRWDSIPGASYQISTAANLAGPWLALAGHPSPFVASTNTLSYVVPTEDHVRFFQTVLEDPLGAPPNPDPSKLVWIPPGTFTMGSPKSEPGRWYEEDPQTVVTLTRGFFIGRHEVTQAEYVEVMGVNPSVYAGGELDRPVEELSWADATNYCAALTDFERAAGRLPAGWEYRIPTEAQWEYACRAGTTTPFGIGSGTSVSALQGNFGGTYGSAPGGPSLGQTTTVGSYAPNPWGLYDMHGNVWEWCWDCYRGGLPGGSVTDLVGPTPNSGRKRGGSYCDGAGECRSAVRSIPPYPFPTYGDTGLRVVLVRVT